MAVFCLVRSSLNLFFILFSTLRDRSSGAASTVPLALWLLDVFGQWGGIKQETERKVEREVLNPPAFLQALGLTWLHSLPRMGAALTDISSSQSLAHLLSLF